MSLWKSIKDIVVVERKSKELLHAQVLREIEAGIRRDGLWAQAIVRAGGLEDRAKAEYIKLAVDHLRDKRYVEERRLDAMHEETQRVEAMRLRKLEDQQRATQLVHSAERKRQARIWGYVTAILLWIAGIVFFSTLSDRGIALDGALLMGIVFVPCGWFLGFVLAGGAR